MRRAVIIIYVMLVAGSGCSRYAEHAKISAFPNSVLGTISFTEQSASLNMQSSSLSRCITHMFLQQLNYG